MLPDVIHKNLPVAVNLRKDVNLKRVVTFRMTRPGTNQNFMFTSAPEMGHEATPEFFGKAFLILALLYKFAEIIPKTGIIKKVEQSDFLFTKTITKYFPLHRLHLQSVSVIAVPVSLFTPVAIVGFPIGNDTGYGRQPIPVSALPGVV